METAALPNVDIMYNIFIHHPSHLILQYKIVKASRWSHYYNPDNILYIRAVVGQCVSLKIVSIVQNFYRGLFIIKHFLVHNASIWTIFLPLAILPTVICHGFMMVLIIKKIESLQNSHTLAIYPLPDSINSSVPDDFPCICVTSAVLVWDMTLWSACPFRTRARSDTANCLAPEVLLAVLSRTAICPQNPEALLPLCHTDRKEAYGDLDWILTLAL